jgi:hypothetical protein
MHGVNLYFIWFVFGTWEEERPPRGSLRVCVCARFRSYLLISNNEYLQSGDEPEPVWLRVPLLFIFPFVYINQSVPPVWSRNTIL